MTAPYWSTRIPWSQVHETLDALAGLGWEREEAIDLLAHVLDQTLLPVALVPYKDLPALEATLALLWAMPSKERRPLERNRTSTSLSEAVEKIRKLSEQRREAQT